MADQIRALPDTSNPLTIVLLCFASLVLAEPEAARASEVFWPGWLGPNRDGRVDYFKAPDPWPDALKKEWSLEVGEGSTAPVVVGDLVYQHARQGGEEVVWGIDARTGKVLWRQSYPVPYQIPYFGERHGDGPLSNPAYADGRLFTLSVTGILTAWDAQRGDLLWRRDYADRFRVTHPRWGHSTSPLVDGDQVIVHFGGDYAGVLVAMDVATGDVVWTEGQDGACHASPIIVELEGVRQIVEWNHDAVVGIESGTGRRLWDYPLQHTGSNQNSPTPVHHRGLILIGGENRGIRCLAPKMQNGEWIVEELWHQRRVSLNMASAIISDDRLFGMSHFRRGQLFSLDPSNGDVLWQGPSRLGEYATFLTIPGRILFLRDDATLEILQQAEDGYRTAASYDVGNSPTWSAPTLLRDGILVKDRTTLFRWSFE